MFRTINQLICYIIYPITGRCEIKIMDGMYSLFPLNRLSTTEVRRILSTAIRYGDNFHGTSINSLSYSDPELKPGGGSFLTG
jgi:hypothetical protein